MNAITQSPGNLNNVEKISESEAVSTSIQNSIKEITDINNLLSQLVEMFEHWAYLKSTDWIDRYWENCWDKDNEWKKITDPNFVTICNSSEKTIWEIMISLSESCKWFVIHLWDQIKEICPENWHEYWRLWDELKIFWRKVFIWNFID